MNINPFYENNYLALEKEKQNKNLKQKKEFNNEYEFTLLETSYDLHISKDKLNEFNVEAEINLLNIIFNIFSLQTLANLLEKLISIIVNSDFLENKLIGKFLGKSKFVRFLKKLLLFFNFQLILRMFAVMLALGKFKSLLQAQIKANNQEINLKEIKELNLRELEKKKELPSKEMELAEKKDRNFSLGPNLGMGYSGLSNQGFSLQGFSGSSLTNKEEIKTSKISVLTVEKDQNSLFKPLNLEDKLNKKDDFYRSKEYAIQTGALGLYNSSNMGKVNLLKYIIHLVKEGVKLVIEMDRYTNQRENQLQKPNLDKGFVREYIEGVGKGKEKNL